MATRRILVTGANKGIGKATVAAILAAADDTMVLLGSRDLGRGEAAVADILSAQPAFKGDCVCPLSRSLALSLSLRRPSRTHGST